MYATKEDVTTQEEKDSVRKSGNGDITEKGHHISIENYERKEMERNIPIGGLTYCVFNTFDGVKFIIP